jgi:hypothetical protein
VLLRAAALLISLAPPTRVAIICTKSVSIPLFCRYRKLCYAQARLTAQQRNTKDSKFRLDRPQLQRNGELYCTSIGNFTVLLNFESLISSYSKDWVGYRFVMESHENLHSPPHPCIKDRLLAILWRRTLVKRNSATVKPIGWRRLSRILEVNFRL